MCETTSCEIKEGVSVEVMSFAIPHPAEPRVEILRDLNLRFCLESARGQWDGLPLSDNKCVPAGTIDCPRMSGHLSASLLETQVTLPN